MLISGRISTESGNDKIGERMEQDDLLEGRRQRLEAEAISAVLDLFKHMGDAVMSLKIPNPTPPLYIVAGEAADIVNEARRIAEGESSEPSPPPSS